MAEVVAMRSNCLPYPVYGVPWTVVVPIMDADGDLVTAATTPDSEVSKNGDTFADCTNEATEIATSSGMYYLTLTGTEMTADIVSVIVKSATAGAKTTALTLYPRKLVPLRTGTAQGGDTGYITLDASAGAVNDMWNGCLCVATIDSNVEARLIDDYNGSNQQASVTPDWNVAPDSDDTFVIYLTEGQQLPSVDVVAVSGDATAADNLELQYDTTGLVGATFPARQDHAAGYHGAIWIDTNNGTAGTTAYVHGTADKPTASLADALTLATALGINRFHLLPGSSITMTADSLKQEWIGYGATIAGGNYSQAGSYFEGATLTGDWNGAIRAQNCILTAFSNSLGYFFNCILKGTIWPGTGHTNYAQCSGDGLTGGLDALIDCSLGNCDLSFTGYYGKISFASITASDLVLFDSPAGEVILQATCTAGDFVYRGLPRIQDNSDGTTVYDYTGVPKLVDDVWDELIAGHAVSGSVGEALAGAGSSADITDIKAVTDKIAFTGADPYQVKADVTHWTSVALQTPDDAGWNTP